MNASKTLKLELVKTCCRIEELNEIIDSSNSELKAQKEKLIKIMDMLKIDEYSLPLSSGSEQSDEITNARFCITTRTKINYDIPKLKEKLDKSILNKIVHKKIEIVDFETFKEIMKKFDVPFKKVKKTLSIEEKVDTPSFEDQFKKGNIELEEIADCYLIQKSRYVRIQKSR